MTIRGRGKTFSDMIVRSGSEAPKQKGAYSLRGQDDCVGVHGPEYLSVVTNAMHSSATVNWLTSGQGT
jgi:hypothetical protein